MLQKVDISIHFSGEYATGIIPHTDTISLEWDLNESDERERVREIIQTACDELYDDKPIVIFGDECEGCMKLVSKCTCLKYETEEK